MNLSKIKCALRLIGTKQMLSIIRLMILLLSVVISGTIGWYLDTQLHILDPAHGWMLGFFSGYIAGLVGFSVKETGY
jgi:hypothetical protein